MTTSQTDPALGRLIDGRYQVRSRIARGGMATVYLATDIRLDRRVAIKIMHGHLADDSAFRERFVQEARSAARLAHPNVVSVFDQGQDSEMAYLVMEYLPGITLRDLLKEYHSLTPVQTLEIMYPVLSGLAAAHRAGIIHRDLKPENVLLADDGRIKIGDFGLARAASANTTAGQALLGTIAYLSPELVTRGVADSRSDIYAIGIMLFEMLTGEQPFRGEQAVQVAYQHAHDTVPLPSSLNPRIPPELDELVLWATEKDPERRPADASELLARLSDVEHVMGVDHDLTATKAFPRTDSLNDLTEVVQPLPAVPAATTAAAGAGVDEPLTTLTRRRRTQGWWLLVLVLVLAALSGGTGWYFGAGPGSLVTVPHVTGLPLAQATTTVKKLGFTARNASEYSVSVPAGVIIQSQPASGQAIARGATVTLFVSQGPKPITLPQLAGLAVADAQTAIKTAGAVTGTEVTQFDHSVAAGHVISASRASDGSDISNGGSYFEAATVNLVVSAGAIPDVTGQPVAAATAALKAVNLGVTEGEQQYSSTVPSGSVISVQLPGEIVKPGDTLTLTVSKGPAPVAVPNVVGDSWSTAKQALTSAGFQLSYPTVADLAPEVFTVSGVSPSPGTMAPFGSTVTVKFAGF